MIPKNVRADLTSGGGGVFTCKGHDPSSLPHTTPTPIILRDKEIKDSPRRLSSEESSRVLNSLLPAGVTGQRFRTANKNSSS